MIETERERDRNILTRRAELNRNDKQERARRFGFSRWIFANVKVIIYQLPASGSKSRVYSESYKDLTCDATNPRRRRPRVFRSRPGKMHQCGRRRHGNVIFLRRILKDPDDGVNRRRGKLLIRRRFIRRPSNLLTRAVAAAMATAFLSLSYKHISRL